jgi:hypothetical protein
MNSWSFGCGAHGAVLGNVSFSQERPDQDNPNEERTTRMMKTRRLFVEQLESRIVPTIYHLHQGDSLQNAINMATQGDTILLDPGATFMGPITLGSKIDRGMHLTIETAGWSMSYGQRVSPSNASAMAEILSPGSDEPAIQTEPGADRYLFVGLNITSVSATSVVDTLVTLGDGTVAQTNTPHDIALEQCYIHGLPGQDIKRGVALNAANLTVSDSYLSGFKSVQQDSQALAGWNGPGFFNIFNNYLEAAGENVLFGGAYGYVTPSNITIRGNLFSKPLSWNPNDPSYAGTPWSVKNLLELKNANSVTITGNHFQNNWVQSQSGYAIVFTPRGAQSGGSWVTVSNVSFTNNILDHTANVFDILGSDDSSASQVTTNILIGHNLFGNDIGTAEWGAGSGTFLELLSGLNGGSRGVVVDHNTVLANIAAVIVSGTHTGFQYTNNILFSTSQYTIYVNGLGETAAAWAQALPGYLITHNAIIWGDSSQWPSGNFYPAFSYEAGFVRFQYPDFADGDFQLASTSPYHNAATDGTDLGANIASLSSF